MRRLIYPFVGALLLMSLAIPFLSEEGAAVKLGAIETLVETTDYNETSPKLDGSWLIWKDDNGTGAPYPSTYRLLSRDMTLGPSSDRVVATNVSSWPYPQLQAPWVAYRGMNPVGGTTFLLYDLEAGKMKAPDLGYPGNNPTRFWFSQGKLYSNFVNTQSSITEFWSHDPATGANEKIFEVDGTVWDSWHVDYPRFVFHNGTVGNGTLWMYEDGGRADGFSKLHEGDSHYDLFIVGSLVIWTESSDTGVKLYLMSITTLSPKVIREWVSGTGYATSFWFDGTYIVWTYFKESSGRAPSGANAMAEFYVLSEKKVYNVVDDNRANSDNQSYLFQNQHRFVWKEKNGGTYDIWWRTAGSSAKASKAWLDFSYPEKDGDEVEDDTSVLAYATEEGSKNLDSADRFRLLLQATALDEKVLWETSTDGATSNDGVVRYHDEVLFKLNFSNSVLYGTGFYLEGVLYTKELPNGKYTLRIEALDSSGKVLSYGERVIIVEHKRVDPGPAVAATVVGAGAGIGAAAVLSGGMGAAGGGGAAAATAAAPQGEGVGSKTRRKKTLKGGKHMGLISMLVALCGLVIAYAYASLASPTYDPLHNLQQFQKVVFDDFGGFLSDLGKMVLFLLFAMALILLFRSWVDKVAAAKQGVRSVFRMQIPGLAALGLSTALFGMPFGYPAQTLHEKKAGFELREARIALASVCGVLVLILPFWLLWATVESARFMAEIGMTVVLMTAFSIAIPSKHTEGRAIFRWRKPISIGLVVGLVLIFYGWQFNYLPTLLLPLIGLAAIAALPSFMQVGPMSIWFLDKQLGEMGLDEELPPEEDEDADSPEDEAEDDEDEEVQEYGMPPAEDTDTSAPTNELPDEPLPPSEDLPQAEDLPPTEELPTSDPLPDDPLPDEPMPGTGDVPAPSPVVPLETPEPPAEAPEPPIETIEPPVEAPAEPPAAPEEPTAPEPPEELEEEPPAERQAVACTGCGKAIDTNWKLCPYCSARQ